MIQSGEDVDMISMATHLQEVYSELAQVLRRPEAFGLGQAVPQPLLSRLEATLKTLDQAIICAESEMPVSAGMPLGPARRNAA
jgi:hypothetical protein